MASNRTGSLDCPALQRRYPRWSLRCCRSASRCCGTEVSRWSFHRRAPGCAPPSNHRWARPIATMAIPVCTGDRRAAKTPSRYRKPGSESKPLETAPATGLSGSLLLLWRGGKQTRALPELRAHCWPRWQEPTPGGFTKLVVGVARAGGFAPRVGLTAQSSRDSLS